MRFCSLEKFTKYPYVQRGKPHLRLRYGGAEYNLRNRKILEIVLEIRFYWFYYD